MQLEFTMGDGGAPARKAPGVDARAILEDWAAERSREGKPLSASSLTVYRAMWGKLCRWSGARGLKISQLTASDLDRFLGSAGEKPGAQGGSKPAIPSLQTQKRYLGLVRDVLEFYYRGRRPNPAAELLAIRERRALGDPQEAPRAPVVLTEAQERDMRERLAEPPVQGSWKRLRDWAMLKVILATGVKPSEATSLKASGVRCDRGPGKPAWFVEAPGSGTSLARTIQVPPWAAGALEQWVSMRERLGIPGDALFPGSRTGEALSNTSLYRHTRDTLVEHGVDKRHMGASVLRATFGARQIAHGANPADVQAWLGLERPESLAPYEMAAGVRRRPF